MLQTLISIQSYRNTVNLLKNKYEHLSEDGCAFLIYSTEYDKDGNVEHDFLELIENALSIGYTYVNTIVYPTTETQDVAFLDNVKYLIWLCKNQEKMKFSKDAIREKHIWKDVEWGKREKNYNPKGKDPGNVWIPTNDDGRANITKHILLTEEDVIKRLLSMSDCGHNYEIHRTDTNYRTIDYASEESFDDNRCEVKGTVVFGTSEKMDQIKNDSVKTIVTSPPYWNLKDYFKDGQIGQESYEEYLARMKTVWTECFNKLEDDGSLWININIRVQNKKTILIPQDFVKMCKHIGFFYKGIIIWHKSSGIPTGDKNIVDRHEYVLVFSKKSNFVINKAVQKMFADYKNTSINGGALWNINRKAGSVGKKYIHPAIYPNELVSRILLVSSQTYDLVVDPFLGSGTSLISALNNKRNFIGYEYNEGFKDLMQSRFEKEIMNFCDVEYMEF